jgi:hypothetical protein
MHKSFLRRAWVASAKFLLRQAVALARLAKETADDECRERCLRLEQVYRRLANAENRTDSKDAGTEGTEARA